ncbi:unnamed protein product [Auanema sp. JU1783]|nr:unnamed protein product [Auanema sp. JU1783]
MMIARSEQHNVARDSSLSSSPRLEMMMDESQPSAGLNCALFVESNKCRWRNSGDDELDWAPVNRVSTSEQWFPYLEVQTYPDQYAGALVSGPRQGWEGGRLESDLVPCIGSSLKLTATVWRSKNSDQGNEPKLQVCTRNQGEERMPLINCADFEIRNGIPMSVDVPVANDPQLPAQVIINGYNFIGPSGGAIFLQDIIIEGTTSCSTEQVDETIHNFARDENTQSLLDEQSTEAVLGKLKNNYQSLVSLENRKLSASSSHVRPIPLVNGMSELQDTKPTLVPPSMASELARSSANAGPSIPTLFETCIALSCNPSDLNCKFWRSSGPNLWEIGSTNRAANPLTGVPYGPGTAQKYLVASFLNNVVNNYILVSDILQVPSTDTFFCFYEYFATEGLTLSICTSEMDCFYSKNNLTIALKENRKWNIRCTRLPEGVYRIRVIAENRGKNKGEVGFLPIRLSRDPDGLDFIC